MLDMKELKEASAKRLHCLQKNDMTKKKRKQRGCRMIGNLLRPRVNLGSKLFKLALDKELLKKE